MPKKRVAKNVCALCLHPKRDAIEKFMQEGRTYKEVKAKFKLRTVSQFTVSRHRNKHMLEQDSIATTRKRTFLDDADILFETPQSVENCVADIKQLVMLSKEFATLARAALRTGATRDAIAALSQVRACQESIAKYRLEKAKAPHELQKPVFHITFREPGERDTDRLLHVVHDNLQAITKKYGETILDKDGKPIFETEFKLIGYIGHKYREFLKAHPEIEPAPPVEPSAARPAPIDPEAEAVAFADMDTKRRQEEEAEELERQAERARRREAEPKSAVEVWEALADSKDKLPN